jgi:hypothetical protein
LPISAVDTITLAFQHTKRQLIQPFRFWQWARLAIVGLLAGEMSSGGGNFSFPSNFNFPQHGGSRNFLPEGFPDINPALLGALIAILVVAGVVFVIVMMYLSSMMRFILFDSVLAKECHIRKGWRRRQGEGWRYFLFQLAFSFAILAGLTILVGVPLGFAFLVGWLKDPSEHVFPLVVGGIILFFAFLAFCILIAVIHVLIKDFVVPQMALEHIGVLEGWRRLWPMMKAEKGGYAVYIGMKIVLAIGASIIIGILTVILGLFIVIPSVLIAVLAAATGKSAGLTWDVYTITLAVVIGCLLFAGFMYLIAFISVPVIVFFPAYSIYFFAPRYPALSVALYGRPAAPPEPPPLLAPEPIG